MKSNTKKFLALLLAVAMVVTPVTSLRAEEPNVQGQENAENEQQEEVVEGEEAEQGNPSDIPQNVEPSKTEEKVENPQTMENETVQLENQQNISENEEITTTEIINQSLLGVPMLLEEGEVDNTSIQIPTGDVGIKVLKVSDNTEYKMFKIANSEAVISGNQINISMYTANVSYSKIYLGNVNDATLEKAIDGIKVNQDGKSGWVFHFSVSVSDAGSNVPIALYNPGEGKGWYKKTPLVLQIPAEIVGETEPDPIPTPGALENGRYIINATCTEGMFSIDNCILTVDNGMMTAELTLSTKKTGYDYLFVGSGEDAEKGSGWIGARKEYKEGDTIYRTFDIPVLVLDKEILIAARSIANDEWYDRHITFSSEGAQKVTDSDSGNHPSGSTGNTGNSGSGGSTGSSGSQNNSNPDSESKYESDLSGSTGKVNNTTKLKDGVYTPDSFTWSGGTGRVSISCTKITITNGQAYATIVFSSPNYSYVKANGNKYYATVVGGTSVFTIPVELNKNNQIIGMTTAMSTAHEVAYNIFIYLAAAGEADDKTVIGSGMGSSKKLDEEAPDILGLEYEDEVTLDYAEYFKIYKYEQGITLLEIDLVSGTVREDAEDEETEKDSKKKVESEDETENVEDDDSAETSEETASNVQTQEEIVAELYKENVVKYLIVPEGVEIPAGLDKEVVVIQQPVDKTYAASDDILEQLEQMDMLDQVAAVACEEDDCKIDAIADKMEKEEISFAGTYEEPDFKKLISTKCNLALLPADILPQEEEEDEKEDLTVEEQKERFFEQVEKYALLDIPVVIDRSADEEEELAQKEWVKIYGAIFGCEEKAEELFHAAAIAKK